MPAWTIRIVGGGGVDADRVTTVRGRDLGLDCRTRSNAAVFQMNRLPGFSFCASVTHDIDTFPTVRPSISLEGPATENAGVENAIRANLQRWKMQEWKMRE